jgi:hypothetical protein
MMDDWRSIETAPRDGTVIEVMDPDCGRFQMRWNPAGHNPIFQREYGNGIWECPGNNFTWSEDEGAGPRYWRPAPPVETGDRE